MKREKSWKNRFLPEKTQKVSGIFVTYLKKLADRFIYWQSSIAKKETKIFVSNKQNSYLSFNPYSLAAGAFVFVVFLSSLFVATGVFFPRPQPSQNSLIQTAVVYPAGPIIAGQTVKWVAVVSRVDITSNQFFLKLPKSASNIKVKTLSSVNTDAYLATIQDNSKTPTTNKTRQQLAGVAPKGKNPLFADLEQIASDVVGAVADTVSDLASQITGQVQITGDAKVVDLSAQADLSSESTETPEESTTPAGTEEPASTFEPSATPSEEPSPSSTPEPSVTPTEGSTPSPSPESTPALEEQSPAPTPTPSEEDTSDKVLVEYETVAPEITEQNTKEGKLVTVSSEDQLNQPPLTDVLAFTKIPEIYKVGQESKIKVKWQNNGGQDVAFHAYDLNGNGKLDYVEWTVPHLSEQIFEIIFISKALQLDSDQNIIADVYDQVHLQDNVWAAFTDGQYVRVTFDKILDSTKDNTIYAKPTDSSKPATIEVYPVYIDADGNATEGPKVATFEDINREYIYRVLLKNLQTPTDTFDLKVIGNADIDWVVDPTITLSWTTEANWLAGTPSETAYVHNGGSDGSGMVGVGYWEDFNSAFADLKWSDNSAKWVKAGIAGGVTEVSDSAGAAGTGYLHVISPSSGSDYDATYAVFGLPPSSTLGSKYTLWYYRVNSTNHAASTTSRPRPAVYIYQDTTHLVSVAGSFQSNTFYGRFCTTNYTGAYSPAGSVQVGTATTNVDIKAVVSARVPSSAPATIYSSANHATTATLTPTDATSFASATTFAAGASYLSTGATPLLNVLIDSVWLRGGFGTGTYTSSWQDAATTISSWGNISVTATITGDQSISMIARTSTNGSNVSSQTASIPLSTGTNDYDISSLGSGQYLSLYFSLNAGTTTDTPTVTSASWTTTVGSVAITSVANQTFAVNDPSTTVFDITVTDTTPATITAANGIRIRIPAALHAVWDTAITSVTASGTAVDGSKMVASPVVEYDDSANAYIHVASNFADGNAVTISGLKLKTFSSASSASNLGLVTAGAGQSIAASDSATKAIGVPTIASATTQTVYANSTALAMQTITVTDDATNPAITSTNGIRITIPASLGTTWHAATTTAAVSGTAVTNSKISATPTVTYEDSNRTVKIPVIANFLAGYTAAISGLTFDTTSTTSSSNLQLFVSGASTGQTSATATDSQTMTVSAQTVPDAPTIGVATASNGSASVTFTPGATGGSAITGYTVTSSTGGHTGTGASSPIVVNGLTNGVAYTFTVKATNAIGDSAASSASNSVTPAALALVQHTASTTYSGTGNTSITCALASPATAGDLLVTAIAIDKTPSPATLTQPSGFTVIGSTYLATSVSGGMAYKIAAGGEQSITWTQGSAMRAECWIAEYSGLETSNVLDVYSSAGNESIVTSKSTGTTGTTAQADELAIAVMAVDTGISVDTPRAWSNSFTELDWMTTAGAGDPGMSVATKTLTSTGTVETTYSATGDTGDQMWAIVAMFKLAVPQVASISSTANQTFMVDDSSTAISKITVTDASTPTITAANDIRIKIPASFNMEWDTSDTTATIGGTASGKVSTISYPDAKTLLINVGTNFDSLDTLTIENISFKNFTDVSSADNLDLLVAGSSGGIAAVDSKTITISRPTITIASSTSQPVTVYTNTANNTLGSASIARNVGTGQVTAVIIKENGGTIDAANELRNIKLYLSADDTWDAGDTQIGSTGTFDGADGEVTFTGNFNVSTTPQYLIVRAGVKSTATVGHTIELQFKTISSTDTISGTPLNITGTSTVAATAGATITQVQQSTNTHTYLSPATSITVTLSTPAVAGNLLIAAIATDKIAGTYTIPDDFTLVNSYIGSVSVSQALAYKVAIGGETTVTWQTSNSEESSAWVGEYSGISSTSPLDVSATANSVEATVTSQTSGTTSTTAQADELAVAMFSIDSAQNSTGRSWTNGFTEIAFAGATSTAGLGVATKTLSSTGAQETTASWTGTADQAAGAIATFKAAAVGVPIKISSAGNQTFFTGEPATAISAITITDDTSSPSITDANDIRIKIPASFHMLWNTDDTSAVITGDAADHVSATVSYEDAGKTLLINVGTDFEAGESITVSGLSFRTFSAFSAADNLELEIFNDGSTDATDGKTIFIAAPSISSVANQSFDVGDPATSISAITVTDSASSPVITAANNIRIKIPAGLDMTWNTASASDIVITGTASGKLSATGLISPYEPIVNRYLVNLHGHTTNSDGGQSPSTYMTTYKNLGYTAAAITDHDYFTPDPGVSGIIWLGGVENTAGGGHMGSVNITSRDSSGVRQTQVDSALSQGGFANIHHPSSGWTNDAIVALNNFTSMEIWNSHYSGLAPYADYALSHGKQFWLTADDDLHGVTQIYRGWNVVLSSKSAGEITKADIVHELMSGNFYALGRGDGSGSPSVDQQYANLPAPAEFTDISVNGATVTASIDKTANIQFITNNGTVSQTNNSVTTANYVSSPGDVYVRIVVTYTSGGKSAYSFSNPIYVGEVQSGAIAFEDGNKTLVVDVGENFDAGDAITISGLKFDNFDSGSSGQLALVVSGASGSTAATDDKTVTVAGLPADPSACSASRVSDTQFTVSWTDNSSDETGFKVERSTDGGAFSQIDTSTASPYSDTTTSANHSYQYRVRAYNAAGNSGYSTDSTTNYTTPTAPSSASASRVSDTEFSVSFTDNSAFETGFKVERSTDGGAWSQIGTTATSPYSDTTTSANHSYQYRVRAYNNGGNSGYSTDATTFYTTPASPTIGTPTADSSAAITWHWTDNSNHEDSFRLNFVTGGGTNVTGITADATSYQTSGLTPNTQYSVNISSYRTDRGASSPSSTSSAVYTLANTPSSLSLTVDSTAQISTEWNANSNPSGTRYYIENTTNHTNSGLITDNYWISSGLTCGTTYSFSVTAKNGDGAETTAATGSVKTTDCEGGVPAEEEVTGGVAPPATPWTPPAPVVPAPAPQAGGFSVSANSGASATSSRNVSLNIKGSADTVRMSISNSPDFLDAVQETYSLTKDWTLSDGEGQKTVYVKLFNQLGVPSDTISVNIDYAPPKTIVQQITELPGKVAEQVQNLPEHIGEAINNISENISNVLNPPAPTEPANLPPVAEVVTEQTPESLNGQWDVLLTEPMELFNLSPLPKEITSLIQKLPQLEQALSTAGITTIGDIAKLQDNPILLPNLSQVAQGESANSQAQGIPLDQMTAQQKEKIPDSIIFARDSNSTIDYNNDLLVTKDGLISQQIETSAGETIQLIVKPDKPVTSIKGYFTFKQNGTASVPNVLVNPFAAALSASRLSQADMQTKKELLVLSQFEYSDSDSDGIYTADVKFPAVDGQYDIVTTLEYQDPSSANKEINIQALVDPEGYVYTQAPQGKTRIANAMVSLYHLDSQTNKYQLWLANQYQQVNPQKTDDTGTYSFLVPPGTYYLEVTSDNYISYKSNPFEVREGSPVHMNIELKENLWGFANSVWQITILMAAIIIGAVMFCLYVLFFKPKTLQKTNKFT